jgi:hypothetical protein
LCIDASCIWRWVQAYAPELDNRCRPHLKPTNRSQHNNFVLECLPRNSLARRSGMFFTVSDPSFDFATDPFHPVVKTSQMGREQSGVPCPERLASISMREK